MHANFISAAPTYGSSEGVQKGGNDACVAAIAQRLVRGRERERVVRAVHSLTLAATQTNFLDAFSGLRPVEPRPP